MRKVQFIWWGDREHIMPYYVKWGDLYGNLLSFSVVFFGLEIRVWKRRERVK